MNAPAYVPWGEDYPLGKTWTLRVEEIARDGRADGHDVYMFHVDGARVPPFTNRHATRRLATEEARRLAAGYPCEKPCTCPDCGAARALAVRLA